jgi:hypothetical protein
MKVINRTGENNWITNEIPEVMLKIKFNDGNFTEGQYYSHNGEKRTLLSDTLTCFILEPGKIPVTEGLITEAGQLIEHNYVIKAVLDKENRDKKDIVLDHESDIVDFFNSNFSVYTKNCADTLRMTINLKFDDEGKVQVNSVNPKVSSSFVKEVYRVINKISKVKIHSGNDYSINYRIQCLSELDFKK